jgi:hypothetical protein
MPDLHRLPFYALAGTQDHYFYKLAQAFFGISMLTSERLPAKYS